MYLIYLVLYLEVNNMLSWHYFMLCACECLLGAKLLMFYKIISIPSCIHRRHIGYVKHLCENLPKSFSAGLFPMDVKNKEHKPFRVSIEGNIACGKSTLIRHFASFPDIDTYLEPVDQWRNVQGHNLLDLSYKNLGRWNFMFQSYVQLSRLNIQNQKSLKPVQMFERSLQNNRYCFVEMAYKNKFLQEPEYAVLCEWYNWIKENMDIKLDLIVYLRSSPSVVYERIKQRNRTEEMTVSLNYLTELHDAYEHWLIKSGNAPAPVLELNVDDDLTSVKQLYTENQQLIMGQASL